MKLEEKIKKKYLYTSNNNLFKYLYFFIQKIKSKKKFQKSYSGYTAQDLIVDYFFRNKKKGNYIDVGCYHPFIGNNTYRLHKRGWSGINIDLDFHTIDFFNHSRKTDDNINIGVSDKKGQENLYFVHNRSAINSLDSRREKGAKEIKKINVDTLDNIISSSNYNGEKIDFISIDVEGYELKVLSGFDLKKHAPDLVLIEYIDLKMNKIEFHNQDINHILNSELYNYMLENNYSLVNWLHSDLVFISNNCRDKL